MEILEKNKHYLDEASKALKSRTFFAAFPEHPKAYPGDADEKARNFFKEVQNNKFEELKAKATNWVGEEVSPYTLKPLGIKYPQIDAAGLISNARNAFDTWRKVPIDKRADILIESLNRFKNRFFEVAYATMHTTGQGYMMSFQASGPHAADRALEAITVGYEEISRIPKRADWEKPMGKYNIHLKKEWRIVPKGVGLGIGCSTFPVWNSIPGIYANLISGNSTIIKPHPGAILPIAIVASEIRNVLREYDLDPNICQLAPDTPENPVTKNLAEDDGVDLIDYTGNSVFGSYLEGLTSKTIFTEKTGVNSVILDSAKDIDRVAANLAFSLTLYSGQMCTAPQNFFIPENGIKTPDGMVKPQEFAQKLADQIKGLVENPKAGPFVLGSIQNDNTKARIAKAEKTEGKLWLKSLEVSNPMFPDARMQTPIIIEVSGKEKEKFSQELFGPVALIITTESTRKSVELAREMAENYGAISCGAYSTDRETVEFIADEMALAATPVSFNLDGGWYINQNASFSDFHVTGGNPAGNASFTNSEFLLRRFTVVGHKYQK